jgi:hypothetical protein
MTHSWTGICNARKALEALHYVYKARLILILEGQGI